MFNKSLRKPGGFFFILADFKDNKNERHNKLS